jgi:hypothetical protein
VRVIIKQIGILTTDTFYGILFMKYVMKFDIGKAVHRHTVQIN